MVVTCIPCRSGLNRQKSLDEQGQLAADDLPTRLQLDVHSAQLLRSFAKVGLMYPYVVVTIDDREVYRTPVAKGEHKSPKWEASHIVALPSRCTLGIAVKSATRMGSDALCGSATVQLDKDMESFSQSGITLERNGQTTGTVQLSLKVLSASTLLATSHFEHIDGGAESLKRGRSSLTTFSTVASLSDSTVTEDDDDDSSPEAVLDESEDASGDGVTEEASKEEVQSEVTVSEASLQLLVGTWTCIATTGLEEFLKQAKLAAIPRRLVLLARWPSWEFNLADGKIIFINHAQLGALREEVLLDGSEYKHKDLQGRPLTSSAKWERTEDGGILVTIWRECEAGDFCETRRVVGDTMEFVLTKGDGTFWGRTFKRD